MCRMAMERRATSTEGHGAHHPNPQRQQRGGLAGGVKVGGHACQVRVTALSNYWALVHVQWFPRIHAYSH